MFTNKLNTFYILIVFIVLSSCGKSSDYPIEPVITFISLDKNMLDQSDLNQDSIFVTIGFTDGDGDLGAEPQENTQNIFITDNRTGFTFGTYKLPAIPKEGANNGVKGSIQIKLYSTCCIFPDLTPPCTSSTEYPTNDLTLDIYIKDRAGNQSNTITTSNFILNCK